MRINPIKYFVLTLLSLIIIQFHSLACSMYKITNAGKTMVGCNHDTWFTTPKIWFENAQQPNEYGAAFTGARQVSGNRTTPQSGMNVRGLTFSRLSAYHPTQKNLFSERLQITDEANYLTHILHTCATVAEVKKHIEQYDHSYFINDVFIYIDSTGHYLIVEPYTLTLGNDPTYVQANFCPSITSEEQARAQGRYRNGTDFISANPLNTSLSYCRNLSDTMSVCRDRNKDGTLLTSIWDTKEKSVNLYFYHTYDAVVTYSLVHQLSLGDHGVNIQDLFPANKDFQRLVAFKTPSNTVGIRIVLVAIAGLLGLLSISWLASLIIRKKRPQLPVWYTLIFMLLNGVLMAYMLILITNKAIFYFDAPYSHYSSTLISAFSYTPFVLLLGIFPILLYTLGQQKNNALQLKTKASILTNLLLYFILIGGFYYWGLYQVW